MDEKPIETQNAIAEFMGISRRTLNRRLKDMKQAGCIFKKKRRAKNGGIEIVYWSWPSLLQRYEIMRNAEEEE